MTIFLENRTLLNEFRRGQQTALTAVYRAYAKDLFAFLANGFSITTKGDHRYFNGYKQPWKLENAVQEVFVRAFSDSARISYDGIHPYKNFLFTIAKNYVVDRFRKNRREFVPVDEITEGKLETDPFHHQRRPSNPEKDTFEQQIKKHVTQFLRSLGPKERALYEMRFVQGQSIEAAAKKLGVTEYRVKRDARRLKKRFFTYMKRHGYFEGYRYGQAGIHRALAVLLAQGGWV